MDATAADHELAAMLPRVAAAAQFAGEPVAAAHADLGAVELLESYAAGSATPGQVVEACLDRIESLDGDLHAMLAVDGGAALAAAERSAARWRAGVALPLDGVPVLVKDLLDTAGLVTTGGSLWLAGRVPGRDAIAVAAVRRAGGVVLGKTSTYELGCGNEQMPFGVTRNPWDATRITGGSSAGSAAGLAARYAPLALGTDTGGSIRIPSAWCGVVGLKPTLGRVPLDGILALAPTLDAVGPMARSAADAAALFAIISGSPPKLAIPAQLRVGVPRRFFTEVLADDVAARFEEALADLALVGFDVVDVDVPGVEHGAALSWLITMYEAARTYAAAPRDQLSPTFRGRLDVGDRVGDDVYRSALRARRGLTGTVIAGFGDCDLLAVPACVSTAPPFDDVDRPVAGVPNTWPDVSARTMAVWNVTGLPALALPVGIGIDGLPIGMQLVGRPYADELCLSAGAAFQAVTQHHLLAPPSIIERIP